MPTFAWHIGIDYLSPETPTSSLKRLRICSGHGDAILADGALAPARKIAA